MNFSEDSILIRKSKRLLDDERTPMLKVGSKYVKLGCLILVNLGNVRHEAAITQQPLIPVVLAFVFSGFTSWTLLVIEAPWNGVLIFATAGLHAFLLMIIAIPLWYEYQTARPGRHLTVSK